MTAGAFTSEGVTGGALGAMIIGFQRAVFSNEAGIGSATIAHSAVRTSEPLTEGYVSLLEPFTIQAFRVSTNSEIASTELDMLSCSSSTMIYPGLSSTAHYLQATR